METTAQAGNTIQAEAITANVLIVSAETLHRCADGVRDAELKLAALKAERNKARAYLGTRLSLALAADRAGQPGAPGRLRLVLRETEALTSLSARCALAADDLHLAQIELRETSDAYDKLIARSGAPYFEASKQLRQMAADELARLNRHYDLIAAYGYDNSDDGDAHLERFQ